MLCIQKIRLGGYGVKNLFTLSTLALISLSSVVYAKGFRPIQPYKPNSSGTFIFDTTENIDSDFGLVHDQDHLNNSTAKKESAASKANQVVVTIGDDEEFGPYGDPLR